MYFYDIKKKRVKFYFPWKWFGRRQFCPEVDQHATAMVMTVAVLWWRYPSRNIRSFRRSENDTPSLRFIQTLPIYTFLVLKKKKTVFCLLMFWRGLVFRMQPCVFFFLCPITPARWRDRQVSLSSHWGELVWSSLFFAVRWVNLLLARKEQVVYTPASSECTLLCSQKGIIKRV